LVVLSAALPVRAAYQIPAGRGPGPTAAVALDEPIRRMAEVERAVKAFERGEVDACLKQLEQAVKAHPELPPAQALFARLAFQGKQTGLIRPALERAAVQAPDHPDVYLLCANLALLEGRLTDAAVHLEKASALATAPAAQWTAGQKRQFALLGHQGMALVAEGRGDWKAARQELTAWLALEPNNGGARQRLGKAFFQLKEYTQAQAELERAAKDDPALDPAALTMGWLFTAAGDLKKAEEWMNYAVKLAPDSVAVRFGFASWLLEQGRGDEAAAQAEAAARLDPASNAARRLTALVALQRKDFAAAERTFQELATAAPGDAWLRNHLALVLAEQAGSDRLRRALELAELSVRQNPSDAQALATLGTVYYRQHRGDEAEKVLQAVVASGKGNSDAAYFLARVKADRGAPDGAASLLRTALAAPGLFLFRKDAQQWLDRLTTSSAKSPN
jgi:tetratricopeptide (TPR) repeat protein